MDPGLWMASLHGGHCGEFCEHARGTLRGALDAAVEAGFRIYGLSEHAPRYEQHHIYDSERAKGYTLERLQLEFERYAEESRRMQRLFEGRLSVLRGFEAEVVPSDRYAELMQDLRSRHAFDYMVGSVHHVAGISIDESPRQFGAAVDACGGLEPVAVRYYETVRQMIEDLRPEVVGHFDLLKLHAPAGTDLATPRIRRAAEKALAAALDGGCILDLNTAGWRKGLGEPYPGPWIVQAATAAGIPFCFGDDSHDPSEVGYGIERARQYLLSNGVSSVTVLESSGRTLARRAVLLPM